VRTQKWQGSRNRQRGLTLIEVLVAVVLYSIILGALAVALSSAPKKTRQAAAAAQLKTLGPAINEYVKANYKSLSTTATPTHAVIVPLATLVTQNYLPANFSATNPYDQTYKLYVTQPTTGNLLALILGSGGKGYTATQQGRQFADVEIPAAAALVGAAGGYVATGDVSASAKDAVHGAYGGWQVDIAGTNIPNPGPGHLAFMHYYNQGSLASDYLYRYKIPGQPDLNKMFTDLDMGDNDVNNAKNITANDNIGAGGVAPDAATPSGVGKGVKTWDMWAKHEVAVGKNGSNKPAVKLDANGNVIADAEVSAEKGNVKLSHAVTYETMASNGTTIPRPTYCPAGSSPQIFLTPVMISSGSTAAPMGAYQAWASNAGGHWVVHARLLTEDGWRSPPAPYLVVKASVKCG
jgi:prepilin-type N-terminal cleavage/methylation domain-containing protein